MKLFERLSIIPEKTYIFIFAGIFLVMTTFIYFLREDTYLLERKIVSKQKDLAAVITLRESYETKKRAFERYSSKTVETQRISLGLIEEMVAKNFIGGRLAMLQPSTVKEQKGEQQTAVELKVNGAALGEVVSFLKSAEASGLHVRKLRVSIPASNPGALDVHATIMERYSRG
jgi:hypothetical protein